MSDVFAQWNTRTTKVLVIWKDPDKYNPKQKKKKEKKDKHPTTIITATTTTKQTRKRESFLLQTVMSIITLCTTKSYLLTTQASDWFLTRYIINFPSLPFRRFVLGFLMAMLSQNVKCGLYTYNIFSGNFQFFLFVITNLPFGYVFEVMGGLLVVMTLSNNLWQ